MRFSVPSQNPFRLPMLKGVYHKNELEIVVIGTAFADCLLERGGLKREIRILQPLGACILPLYCRRSSWKRRDTPLMEGLHLFFEKLMQPQTREIAISLFLWINKLSLFGTKRRCCCLLLYNVHDYYVILQIVIFFHNNMDT